MNVFFFVFFYICTHSTVSDKVTKIIVSVGFMKVTVSTLFLYTYSLHTTLVKHPI